MSDENPSKTEPRGLGLKWCTVAVFAVAMAWVEAAVVYYLRTMLNRIEPYQANPLPLIGGLGQAELIREAATLVMLLAVGLLAGNSTRQRLGYAAIAFGIWDVFYYVFLKVLCDWPHSLLDWDILFLLPLPWWGPVLAPVLIAALMIFWGTLVTSGSPEASAGHPPWGAWALNFAGIGLALYVFMREALQVSHQGSDAVRNALPKSFHWPLFICAWLLMACPVIEVVKSFNRSSATGSKTRPRLSQARFDG